jgi:hypothetical protein
MIFIKVCSTWSIVQLKRRLDTWITRNDVNGVSLYHLSYLINLMVYLCSHWTPKYQIKYFMFHWSIYRLFVLNTSWKRDSLQTMIFENVCSTWIMVECKTQFVSWITSNDISGVTFFHLSHLITLKAHNGHEEPKLSILCLIDLQNICAKYKSGNVTFPNQDIHICLLDMKHIWTKNAFWDVNKKKWRKWCNFVTGFLFNNT